MAKFSLLCRSVFIRRPFEFVEAKPGFKVGSNFLSFDIAGECEYEIKNDDGGYIGLRASSRRHRNRRWMLGEGVMLWASAASLVARMSATPTLTAPGRRESAHDPSDFTPQVPSPVRSAIGSAPQSRPPESSPLCYRASRSPLCLCGPTGSRLQNQQ